MTLEIKAKATTLKKVMLKTRDGLIAISGNTNPTTQLSSDGKMLGTSVKNKVDVTSLSPEHLTYIPPNSSKSLYLDPASVYDLYIGDLTVPVLTNVTGNQLAEQNKINNVVVQDVPNQANFYQFSAAQIYGDIAVSIVKKDNNMTLKNPTVDLIYTGDVYTFTLSNGSQGYTKFTFTQASSTFSNLDSLNYTDVFGNVNTLYANTGKVDKNNLIYRVIYKGWDAWNNQYIALCNIEYRGAGSIYLSGLPTLSTPMSMPNTNGVWMSVEGQDIASNFDDDIITMTSPIAANRLEFTMPDDGTFFSIYVQPRNQVASLLAINGDPKVGTNIPLKTYTLSSDIKVQVGKINPGVNDGKYFISAVSSPGYINVLVVAGITSAGKSSIITNSNGKAMIATEGKLLVGAIDKMSYPKRSNPFSVTEKVTSAKPRSYAIYSVGSGYITGGIYNDVPTQTVMGSPTPSDQPIASGTTLVALVHGLNLWMDDNTTLQIGGAILPTGVDGSGELAIFNVSSLKNWYMDLRLVTNMDDGTKIEYPIPLGTCDSLIFKLAPTIADYNQSVGITGVSVDNPATVSLNLINGFSSNPSSIPLSAILYVPPANKIAATSGGTVLIDFVSIGNNSVRVDFTLNNIISGWTYVFNVSSDQSKDTPATITVSPNAANFSQSLTIKLNSLSTSKSVKLTATVMDGNSSGNGQWINTGKSIFMSPQYGVVDYYNAYLKGITKMGTDVSAGTEGAVSLNQPNLNLTQLGKNVFQLYPNGEWFGKAVVNGWLNVDLNNITMAGSADENPGRPLLPIPINTMSIASSIRTTIDPQVTAVINYPTDLVSVSGPIVEVGDDNGVIQHFSDPMTFVGRNYVAPKQRTAQGRQLYIKFDATLMQKNKITIAGPGLTNVYSYPRGFVYGLSHQASVNLQTLPRIYPQGLVDMSYYLAGCTGLTSVIFNFLDASNITTFDHFMDGAKLASSQGLSGAITSTSAKLVSATAMFNNSVNIDMDMSPANVVSIPVEPTNFATNSNFQSNHKPLWGATPSNPTPVKLDNSTYQGMIIGVKPGRSVFYITANNVRVRDSNGNTLSIINNNSNQTAVQVDSSSKTPTYFYLEPLTAMTDKINALQFKNVDYIVKWHNAGYNITPADQWSTGNYMMLGNAVTQVPTTAPNVGGRYAFLFYGSTLFNDPNVSQWTFSDAIDMTSFMQNAISYNQPFTNANFGKCGVWISAFNGASSFNQSLPNLTLGLSRRQHYNSNLGYATSDVDMMFYNAKAFSQDLSQQCVSNLNDYPQKFCDGSGLVAAQIPVWGTCPLNNPVNWNVVLTKGNTVTYVDNVTAGWITNDQYLAGGTNNYYDSVYYPSQSYLNKNGSIGSVVTSIGEYVPLCSGTVTFDEGVQYVYNSSFGLYSSVSVFIKQMNFPTTLTSFPTSIVSAAARQGTFVFVGTTPPTTDGNISPNLIKTIKVPSSAVATYKSASGWSNYASLIVGY